MAIAIEKSGLELDVSDFSFKGEHIFDTFELQLKEIVQKQA